MRQAGFHRAAFIGYTGFKSSPYTEGALFYGEKPAAGQTPEDIDSAIEPVAGPVKEAECKPGGT